jgi:hypothetical protein
MYSMKERPQSDEIWPPKATKNWSRHNTLNKMRGCYFSSHLYYFGWLYGVSSVNKCPNQMRSGHHRHAKVDIHTICWIKCGILFSVTSSSAWMTLWCQFDRVSSPIRWDLATEAFKNWYKHNMLNQMPQLHFLSHLYQFGWLYGASSIENLSQSDEIWQPEACKNWYKHNMLNKKPAFFVISLSVWMTLCGNSIENHPQSDEIWAPEACKNWYKHI